MTRERFPATPMSSDGDQERLPPASDDEMQRGLGHKQIEALAKFIECYDGTQQGLSAGELGAAIKVNRGQAVAILRSLERRGCLTRNGHDWIDGQPTEKGRNLIASGITAEKRGTGHHPAAIQSALGDPTVKKLFTRRVAPATLQGTVFAGAVVDATEFPFRPGAFSPKLGDRVQKGWWRNLRLYSLAMEERRSCPPCHHREDCFLPGTLVLTADLRWVPVEHLVAGDRIVGFDETPNSITGRRKTQPSIVEAVGRATRASARIRTSKGNVAAANGHLFVARKGRDGYGWHRADSLKPNDDLQHLITPWQQDMSYDAGRVRGFVEGEGYATSYCNGPHPQTRMGWGQLPGKLLDEINRIVRDRGFRLSVADRISGVNGSTLTLVDVKGGWREVARFLGMFRPTRLIERSEEVLWNHDVGQGNTEPAKVIGIDDLGDQEVITIATSTKTLIAEGFLAHNCYGNNSPRTKRYRHGPQLEDQIRAGLWDLDEKHPEGYVIRLHVLGDFYSDAYVRMWREALDNHPGLNVFGFTAHDPFTSRGRMLRAMHEEFPKRWAIRFSEAPIKFSAKTISYIPPRAKIAEGVVCPEQLRIRPSCAACGLCWHSQEPIVFIDHALLGGEPE